ncbi:xanthine dehydrogenase family protein molybdopterin-binding subunit [Arsenicitalea aurantiaca]|uniref:Xanthine dehydrogenase family protein molybdopterin-binding subunit n=1 Tax=Arsenicitalea aurantiaca TaxID=1783274 RepID=A0A433X491_9HYPH|nr:xanthine dehydrogenase family protein molybdopterin-binding subunit [Arsenicitalea aurantiaca]RUT28886.1 xanthine dehydrogenase family protein molybdopterin-binding subunit [Arsenicitalea aurantiaca]
MKFGVGQPVRRVEDKRFITGRGRYVADHAVPGQAHAAIVSSPHAHARILGLDVSAAAAAPGVLAVLTGADVLADGLGGIPPLFMPQNAQGPFGYRTLRPILIPDIVRAVGERVAMVIAETPAQARDAADLIEVDYEPLDAVVTLEAAVAEGAPAVWPDCPGNVSFSLTHGDPAATDAAFAKAAVTVALRLENNRIIANAMEPRAALGLYDAADETYTLYATSQNPHGFKEMIARDVLGIPATRLRVIAPDVGGGFGAKADCYPEDALVLWAARRVGRPVKWVGTRSEGLMGDNHGRDQLVHAELAADAEGRVLAVRARALHAIGAYHFSAGVAPLLYSLRYIPGVYAIDTVDLETRAVFTHTSPLGVYRGAGRPEAIYVIERLMDELATRLGISPVDVRRRNFVPPARMPYKTQTGAVYDTGEFEALFDKALALADWDGFDARRSESEARGRLRGRSVAYYIEHAGIYNDRMEIRFDPTGSATILAGTHSHGQGHATAFAQLVSEQLGIPFEAIGYIQGDTDKVMIGRGTYAARSSLIGGSALKLAGDKIIEKGRRIAAWKLGVEPDEITFDAGMFVARSTNRSMHMTEVAIASFQARGVPEEFALGLSAAATYSGDVPNYPNGCHVCEVEIDPETGAVELAAYAVVDDVGVVINPMIVEGQVHGGLAQGIGQALLEHIVYDPDSGQLVTGTFNDYCMPRADNLGPLAMAHHNVPCLTNPIGVKGCGESGAIGAPPAIMNAILDALRPLGVAHLDMPATPSRVWAAIAAARRAAA